MSNMDELRIVKRYRTAGLAGGLPAGMLTTFFTFRYFNNKYPVPGTIQRRNGMAVAIVSGMMASTFIYGWTWWYGTKEGVKSLPDDSQLKRAFWPNGVPEQKKDPNVVEYPSAEEAARSLGIDPAYANADWKVAAGSVAADQIKFDGKKL